MTTRDDELAASGPVVLAIPGTLCAPAVFRPLAQRLAGQVEFDAVSWMTEPGPWDLGAVADRLAARSMERHGAPVMVIGHSTGGAIALRLTAAHPELVAGLLLVDTGAHMRGHGDVNAILTALATDWGAPLHARVLDRSFATAPDPAFRDELLDYAAAVPVQAALDALRSQQTLDLTPGLALIGCPATVLHGLHDPGGQVLSRLHGSHRPQRQLLHPAVDPRRRRRRSRSLARDGTHRPHRPYRGPQRQNRDHQPGRGRHATAHRTPDPPCSRFPHEPSRPVTPTRPACAAVIRPNC